MVIEIQENPVTIWKLSIAYKFAVTKSSLKIVNKSVTLYNQFSWLFKDIKHPINLATDLQHLASC